MAAETDNETPARHFLLGKLSGEDRSRFEESFLADAAVFEEIEIAEDELIDAYVRDKLSATDRDHVEKNLLRAPRIAGRVKVARVLNRSFASPVVAQPVVAPSATTSRASTPWSWSNLGFGKFAFASLGLILFVSSAALFVQYLRIREQSTQLQAERAALERRVAELVNQNSEKSSESDRLNAELELQRAENARLNDEVERQLDRPIQPVAILPLTLFAGASRGTSGTHSVRLPATPGRLELNLLLETDEYQSYSAVVTSIGGREIGQRSNLKSRSSGNGKVVRFRLSSVRFTPGDYLVNLSGTAASGQSESIASYTFRVLPRAD